MYQDIWPSILSAEDHEHEVGDDVSRCANCRLQEAALSMSAFERACWGWYADNVTPFAMEAGIVGEMFRSEGLIGKAKSMFLGALNEIHRAFDAIRAEKLKSMKEASDV